VQNLDHVKLAWFKGEGLPLSQAMREVMTLFSINRKCRGKNRSSPWSS